MKSMFCTRLVFCAALTASAAFALPQHAQAQTANPLIAVDENGNGSIVFPGGTPFITTGTVQSDPGPGGGSALTYNLLGPPSLVAGDVFLTDFGCAGCISDLIRFNPAGTGGVASYPASLLFYSNDSLGQLADTGLPSASYTNMVTLTEGLNGLT